MCGMRRLLLFHHHRGSGHQHPYTGVGGPRCESAGNGWRGSLDAVGLLYRLDRVGDLPSGPPTRCVGTVPALQQQEASGKCSVPALRKSVSWRRAALVLPVVLAGLVLIDTARPAQVQICGRLYVCAVRGYQQVSRPHLDRVVHCRYIPTCSDYSIEAVQRFGIARGLALTLSRVARCRKSVPVGTPDPVPAE